LAILHTNFEWEGAVLLKERFSRHSLVVHTFVSEEKVVNSRASEMHQFMSAYRASDKIKRRYPVKRDKW